MVVVTSPPSSAGHALFGISLACGGGAAPLDRLCRAINAHDPTHLVGPLIQSIVGPVIVIAIILVGGGIVARLITRSRLDPQVHTLFANAVTAITIVLAVMGGLTAAGLNIDILLTFGGLASLAIGLAFQDMLRNILAGIGLLVEKPFRIGDYVTLGTQLGKVETITLRATAIRTAEGELAIIPNLMVFSAIIINQSAFPESRRTVTLASPDPSVATTLARSVVGVTGTVKGVLSEPPPSSVVTLDGDAVTVTLHYWVDTNHTGADAIDTAVAEKLIPLMGKETT